MSAAYERHFLGRVQALTGIADLAAAKRLAAAVIAVLAEQLRPQDRALLAHFLPPGIDEVPCGPAAAIATFDLFCARVGERAGVRAPFDVEHAQCVCRVLRETLGADQCAYFVKRLPDYFVDLLAEAGTDGLPANVPAASGREHSLATGRPGSLHPLSEAVAGRAAQADSVVRADNPHEATKLSSARGTTQEREGEDLAEGQAGGERPLSTSRH